MSHTDKPSYVVLRSLKRYYVMYHSGYSKGSQEKAVISHKKRRQFQGLFSKAGKKAPLPFREAGPFCRRQFDIESVRREAGLLAGQLPPEGRIGGVLRGGEAGTSLGGLSLIHI